MARYYFTEKGYRELAAEVERLELELKTDIAKQIAEAAAHGDLRENAEYAAAKERQQQVANRLRALKEQLSGANVVRREELEPADAVTFGKTIRIVDVDTGDEREYTILGDGESDPDRNIISYQSPIAAALIGHRAGDTVEVKLPRGTRTFRIEHVDFWEGFRE